MAFKKNEIEFESDKVKVYVQQLQAENALLRQANEEKNELLIKLGYPTTATAKRKVFCLQEQLEAYKMEAEEGKEINAELKTENEKYSLFIEKLCDYAGLECDSEEQAMRTLSDLASQMNKARWIIDRYKQTLTEIKEICKKGKKIHDDLIVSKEILQKISECEVGDENSK